jgi:hypothetical protein
LQSKYWSDSERGAAFLTRHIFPATPERLNNELGPPTPLSIVDYSDLLMFHEASERMITRSSQKDLAWMV